MATNRSFISTLKPAPFSTNSILNSRIASAPIAPPSNSSPSSMTASGVRTQGVFGDLAAGAGAIIGAAIGGPALIVGGAVVGYLTCLASISRAMDAFLYLPGSFQWYT